MATCKDCLCEKVCTSIFRTFFNKNLEGNDHHVEVSCPMFENKSDYIKIQDLNPASEGDLEKKRIASSLELLNYYRNCNYNAPSGTQEYALANAINDILPLVAQLLNLQEHDRTCPNCNADIQKSWGFCPQCGTHVLPAPPGNAEVID